jgi:hypothetical protein
MMVIDSSSSKKSRDNAAGALGRGAVQKLIADYN